MHISPTGEEVRVSGPISGHNAGELIRAITEHNAKTLQLDDYTVDDRQLVIDLLLRVDAWLGMRDRRVGVSVANSPGLETAELSRAPGPDSHILVAESPPGEGEPDWECCFRLPVA